MASSAWKPLLRGKSAARARKAVLAIAEAFAVLPPPEALRKSPWEGRRLADLGLGAPGPALLFGYLVDGLGEHSERAAELADLYLGLAVNTLALVPMDASLFGGFTGVAWASQHVSRLLGPVAGPAGLPDLDAEAYEEIDQTLLETLTKRPWKGDFDLCTGLAGIGVYAVERLPRPAAVRCLAAVVTHLAETASIDERGTTWLTRPEFIPAHRRDEEPLGYFNLGVAHGVPGVLAVLADACRVEPCARLARELLSGAVQWLLALPRAEPAGSRFGKWVSPRSGVVPAPRLAWCYGDPGIAVTLLYAARKARESGWEREALAIARHAARVPAAEAGVVDPALCHGAVGLAHLYNRLYQATAEEPFAKAARSWYRRALDMRQGEEGIAGFCSWGPSADPAQAWRGDPGLLTGASGIGLALLAAISGREPEWDRLLRVAIPPVVKSPYGHLA
jgi:lantibiotic biosynthesis protein